MSQEQLAHIAEITPAYLGQVERGVKNITVRTLEKVCNALNITLCEFFSTGKTYNKTEDDTLNRILQQLTGKTEAEKKAVLKLIKLVFSIKEM